MKTSFLQHAVRTIRHHLRDVGQPARSPLWPLARRQWLSIHGSCAACGAQRGLEVHHKQPYHLFSALELDPSNFITLCRAVNDCHLLIGHGDSFKAYNPRVVVMADAALAAYKRNDRAAVLDLEATAKAQRLVV